MPLLTILFLISYALMTLLIVEQGLTIENQRALIRDLFRDSAELSALKLKAVQENNKQLSGQAKSPAHGPAAQLPSNQIPSKQVPSNEVPLSQSPSDSVRQRRAQNPGNAKPRIQVPSRPASDLADERRSLITI